MDFASILEGYKKIAIVGTYKNAGKTVALNEFVNIAAAKSLRMGLTSIGRDGERKDIVTDTEKPPIYVPKGTFVATAEASLLNFTTPYEIIDVTPFQTAIGRVVVCEVLEDGFIEIAGPDSNSEIVKVCDFMLDLGANVVFIDGALSRKTQASPSVADGVILSTGAVLSRSMDVVVEKTRHTVKMLTLPQVDASLLRICEEAATSSYVSFIDKNNNIIQTKYKTALGCTDKITAEIMDDYEYIVFPGTLMNSFIKSMRDILRFKNIKLVIKDGTKVFIEPMDYRLFEREGGTIEVIDPIKLLAVTVNPYSPDGYYFEPELFKEAMREELYPFDVFDCMQGGS